MIVTMNADEVTVGDHILFPMAVKKIEVEEGGKWILITIVGHDKDRTIRYPADRELEVIPG